MKTENGWIVVTKDHLNFVANILWVSEKVTLKAREGIPVEVLEADVAFVEWKRSWAKELFGILQREELPFAAVRKYEGEHIQYESDCKVWFAGQNGQAVC